jgi:hypothetical protein
VDISIPGYIKKKLQEYNHILPGQIQNFPYSPEPKKFGSQAQAPLEPENTPTLDAKGIRYVQQIAVSILYYAQCVDMTVLMALSLIAVEQTKATEQAIKQCIQLLDYLACNAGAKVRFYALDMIMNTLQLIVPFQITSTKQSVRTLLHGMDAKKWQANPIKWSILHQYNNNEICRGVSVRGQTGTPLPQ